MLVVYDKTKGVILSQGEDEETIELACLAPVRPELGVLSSTVEIPELLYFEQRGPEDFVLKMQDVNDLSFGIPDINSLLFEGKQ